MTVLRYTVPPENEGCKLGLFLRMQGVTAGLIKSVKHDGSGFFADDAPLHTNQPVHAGQCISFALPPEHDTSVTPQPVPFSIAYEDEFAAVLNKPAGIAIHPAALTEETVTVAGAVCHYLRTGSFHCVNRLDRGSTGVMAVAKTGYIHRLCMESLHTDSFLREYRGICLGTPQPSSGAIDLPISRDPGSLLRRTVDPMGLPARTLYETLLPGELSLLRLLPQTGRTHQLRLHLSAVGHPLAGDWLYGIEDPALIPRPALHSYRLRLLHPVSRRWLDVTAPLPEDMRRLLPPDCDPA